MPKREVQEFLVAAAQPGLTQLMRSQERLLAYLRGRFPGYTFYLMGDDEGWTDDVAIIPMLGKIGPGVPFVPPQPPDRSLLNDMADAVRAFRDVAGAGLN